MTDNAEGVTAGVETILAEVEQGRGDYGQDYKDEVENVEDRACKVDDSSRSSGQVVHREVENFMMASEGAKCLADKEMYPTMSEWGYGPTATRILTSLYSEHLKL